MLGSANKVKLTGFLHRLTWVAGQRCYVTVAVVNETKKTIRTLTLTLIRSTTIFKPKPALDTGNARTLDPDSCQTTTMHKVLSETFLQMAHRGTKGHASAKGWWTGVAPGQELTFSHYILLPVCQTLELHNYSVAKLLRSQRHYLSHGTVCLKSNT